MLTVGVPKEIKPLERRVGLTPGAVRNLTTLKIPVFIETGAGTGCGFSDGDYIKAGAEILPTAESLYRRAQLIQKVKEPLPPEFGYLNRDHILFSFLHLASPENQKTLEALLRSRATAIGYETVEVNGKFPLLAPMSEIAGSLGAAYGIALKEGKITSQLQAAAILELLERKAMQYPNFKPGTFSGSMVIWGGGVAGFKAMETALKLHGDVSMVEANPARRDFLRNYLPSVYAPDEIPNAVLQEADILIGCVHARGARAAKVLAIEQLHRISFSKRKVIVDVSIDQGGNFPESHATLYTDPVYFDSFGNLRFGVANIPSLCGRGASEALSSGAFLYTKALAMDHRKALEEFPELKNAINTENGSIKLPFLQQRSA